MDSDKIIILHPLLTGKRRKRSFLLPLLAKKLKALAISTTLWHKSRTEGKRQKKSFEG